MTSDVTAWPGSHGPAQAEPCEAKLYEAPTGLPGAHGLGFTFLKPQAMKQLFCGHGVHLWSASSPTVRPNNNNPVSM